MRHHDIIIIGGGLVGASLAVALAPSGLSVAVVEAIAVNAADQPSFDDRTVALTDDARAIYTSLGVWDDIAAAATPIRDIHISDRGRAGMTHLRAADIGAAALGHVVPARVIGGALHRRIAAADTLTLICPATVTDIAADANAVTVTVADDNLTLTASLVVVADGGRSSPSPPATQHAVVAVVAADRDHRHRAYERFTDDGPIALLPHGAKKYALVWTGSPAASAARMALTDADFTAALQDAFGDRAGVFSSPSPRKLYPLPPSRDDGVAGERRVTIGNAAHAVHPVAGQGFNLGLRDAVALSEVLSRAHNDGDDLGGGAVLKKYARRRRRETENVRGFTDGLIKLFGSERATVKLARNIALTGVEFCPPAKRFLLRRTMGLTARARSACIN